MPKELSPEAIAFAKQSFKHPDVAAWMKVPSFESSYREVQEGILKNVKTKPGGFKATSGAILKYYLNLSTNFLDAEIAPKLINLLATVLVNMVAELAPAPGEKIVVIGPEVAGGMLVCQLATWHCPALHQHYDFVYMRKQRKMTGTAQQLEGAQKYTSRTPTSPNVKCVWIDDVNSTGSSLTEGIVTLQEDYNMTVTTALYFVDRSADRAALEPQKMKYAHPHFVAGHTKIRAIMDLKEIDARVPDV